MRSKINKGPRITLSSQLYLGMKVIDDDNDPGTIIHTVKGWAVQFDSAMAEQRDFSINIFAIEGRSGYNLYLQEGETFKEPQKRKTISRKDIIEMIDTALRTTPSKNDSGKIGELATGIFNRYLENNNT